MTVQSTTTIQKIAHANVAPLQRILVADDDPSIRTLLELTLRSVGYDVISAIDGYELVRLAQETSPHLILADLLMPQMDGVEAIRQLRNDTRTAHIPMIILTAMTRPEDVVIGFQNGADDYVIKPFDVTELLARVNGHLRREARRLIYNPLTRLPGNALLLAEIQARIERSNTPFALVHADLDSFKAYNDTYGFASGDRAILLVADVLRRTVTAHGAADDFIGHIGGDDFAVLTTVERAEPLCKAIVATFDREMPLLYDAPDRQRGYLTGTDRYGVLRRFRLMTISLGVATNELRDYEEPDEMARIAAELKHYAKLQGNGQSSYAIDQRARNHQLPNERRIKKHRRIAILSHDPSLYTVLSSAFIDRGYSSEEFANPQLLSDRLEKHHQLTLILIDGQILATTEQALQQLAQLRHAPPIVVLVGTEAEAQQATFYGFTNYIRQPIPLADVVTFAETVCKHYEQHPLRTVERVVGM